MITKFHLPVLLPICSRSRRSPLLPFYGRPQAENFQPLLPICCRFVWVKIGSKSAILTPLLPICPPPGGGGGVLPLCSDPSPGTAFTILPPKHATFTQPSPYARVACSLWLICFRSLHQVDQILPRKPGPNRTRLRLWATVSNCAYAAAK